MNGDDKEEDERPPKMYKGVTKDQWQMVGHDNETTLLFRRAISLRSFVGMVLRHYCQA